MELENLPLPFECTISVSLDGINFSECEEKFLVYSKDIQLTSVAPKAASCKGGTELAILMDVDESMTDCLFHLTVGLQPKPKKGTVSRLPSQMGSGQVDRS